MHVSTAWTDVLSQGRNGEPTSHPLMNVQLKNLFLLCQSHRRFAWHILCMYFWSFVSFLGRHCAVFSYSTPVKLCEWHISLGIPTFCAIILMVTCWLSTTIWWTSATFSSVVTACEGTGHSSSLGLSLPCLISATHSCVWWYITLQSLHHILMNILTQYPPFLRCTGSRLCAEFPAPLNKSPCCLLPQLAERENWLKDWNSVGNKNKSTT